MVSLAAVERGRQLIREGLVAVPLPCTNNTPIPGLMIYADDQHSRVEMVLGDGTTVNLLEVYAAAQDTIRNWHKGSPRWLPHFTGDFGRLNKLAEAINGQSALKAGASQ